MRNCTECGTPLPGRRGQGFPVGAAVLCGRKQVQKSVRNAEGALSLRMVATPRCARQS